MTNESSNRKSNRLQMGEGACACENSYASICD
nr:MAG TPA: hypothetical protein [Bacteriophage sp.]